MRYRKSTRVAVIALGWATLALSGAAYAATGTLQERLLTFSNQPLNTNVEVEFTIETTVGVSRAVQLFMDFTPDGNFAMPSPEPFAAPKHVVFDLSYNGAVLWTFTADDAENGTAAASKTLTTIPAIDATAARAAPGRYQIILTFPHGSATPDGGAPDGGAPDGGVGVDKTWKLRVMDTGADLPRGIFYIEDKGHFKTLTPHGQCTVTNSTSCPEGQTCQGACPFCRPCPPPPCIRKPWYRWCIEKIPWIPKWWTWPPPFPCIKCIPQWQEKFGEEVERVIVEFVALNKDSAPIGEGQVKQIQIEVKGGRAIGPVVDLGASEYAQMVEFRKGGPPAEVSATIAGVTTPAFAAGPEPATRSSPLTTVLAILLVAALLLAAYLARRNRAANVGQ